MKTSIKAMRLRRTKGVRRDYVEVWINADYDPDADYVDDDEGFTMTSSYPIKEAMVSMDLIHEIQYNTMNGYQLNP